MWGHLSPVHGVGEERGLCCCHLYPLMPCTAGMAGGWGRVSGANYPCAWRAEVKATRGGGASTSVLCALVYTRGVYMQGVVPVHGLLEALGGV